MKKLLFYFLAIVLLLVGIIVLDKYFDPGEGMHLLTLVLSIVLFKLLILPKTDIVSLVTGAILLLISAILYWRGHSLIAAYAAFGGVIALVTAFYLGFISDVSKNSKKKQLITFLLSTLTERKTNLSYVVAVSKRYYVRQVEEYGFPIKKAGKDAVTDYRNFLFSMELIGKYAFVGMLYFYYDGEYSYVTWHTKEQRNTNVALFQLADMNSYDEKEHRFTSAFDVINFLRLLQNTQFISDEK